MNGRCGYPLVDALKERYTDLDGRGDRMFVGCKSYSSPLASRSARPFTGNDGLESGLQWLSYGEWPGQVGVCSRVSLHAY